MANPEHVARLEQGVAAWNEWRKANPGQHPDLSGAPLSGAALSEANFEEADLGGAVLTGSHLAGANLTWAYLRGADLEGADLVGAMMRDAVIVEANLKGANLERASMLMANLYSADISGANLCRADLTGANLYKTKAANADMRGASLRNARLVSTELDGADLTGCHIHGIAAWDLFVDSTVQRELVVSRKGDPSITVDDLEVAQFIYLLLHNEKIRRVIDTVGKKAVLILGRYSRERKAVLDALRTELGKSGYVPIVVDFEKPATRDLTETVSTLAHMALFVIADITDARSIPQELQRIVPDLPSVPVQPLLKAGENEYGMFEHLRRFPWVLELYEYETSEALIEALPERVIAPAVKAVEAQRR